MARTKQTARRSTGGKAPRKFARARFGPPGFGGQIVFGQPGLFGQPVTFDPPSDDSAPVAGSSSAAVALSPSNSDASMSSNASMKRQGSSGLKKQDTLILAEQSSRQSSFASSQGSMSRKASKQTSVRKQASKQASVSRQTSKQTSISKQTSKQKSLTKQLSKKASITKQASKQASFSKQASKQASITKQVSKQASITKQASMQGMKRQASQDGTGKKKRVKKAVVAGADSEAPKKKRGRKAKKGNEEKPKRTVLFNRYVFVAVRSPEADEPFYIGETLGVIWSDSDMARIQWFSTRDQPDGIYLRNFPEKIETECLVCRVYLKKQGKDKYELTDTQKKKIEKELEKGERRAQGISSEDEEEEVEESAKKTKGGKRAPKSGLKKQGSKTKLKKVVSTKVKKQSARGAKAEERRKLQEEKRRLREEAKKEKELLAKNPNARLQPRKSFKVYNQDPLLGSREKIPFISTSAHSKLVHRAVYLGDNKLLQEMVDDLKQIDEVERIYSVGLYKSPLQMAMDIEDKKAIQILAKEMYNRDSKKKGRAVAPQSMLSTVGTGRYNHRSLGVHNIRALAMSRGSKEGNNAFTKDPGAQSDFKKYIKHALRAGVDKKTLDVLFAAADRSNLKSSSHDLIWLAVRFGHRKLAGELMQEQEKLGYTTFNALHRNVLLFDKEDLKAPIRAASVRKKPWDNRKMTPVHCAAINPNPKYLAKLMQIVPEYGIMDEKLARPIHYAAACEGPGPLDFLLKRGQDPTEPDGSGLTPLQIACETGRVACVKLLLEKADQDKKDAEENPPEVGDDDYGVDTSLEKYGVGGVNRPVAKPQNMFCGYTPLHLASEKGHLDIVKMLLDHGADVSRELNAGKDKKTSFMLACRAGHMDVVKLLYKAGAAADNLDKLKKSPLMHAVMCGHAHIVSYLLAIGANPNRADSSGNTCVHYAAAYGWYHCLKFLLEAGADANVPNDWKTTPLGIAFMKGHTGLADILLEEEGVDINFKNERGMTLVALACSSPLAEGIVDQIDFLVNQKKADCTLKDVGENTTLHHIASNTVKKTGWKQSGLNQQLVDRSIAIARLLIKKGVDPGAVNESGITPIMAAVDQGNTDLVEFLVNQGGVASDTTNLKGQNILHLMADHCVHNNLTPLLKCIIKTTPADMLKKIIVAVDKEGMTPFLRACYGYQCWDGKVEASGKPDGEEDEEEDEEEEDEEEDDEEDDDEDEAMDSDVDVEEQGMDEDAVEDEEENENDEDEEENEEEENEEEDAEEAETEDFKGAAQSADDDDDDEQNGSVTKPANSVGDNAEVKQRKRQYQDARDFIEALIKLCGADVDDMVVKKKFPPGFVEPKNEVAQYLRNVGKFTAVNFMLKVSNECDIVAKNKKDTEPGLTMILKHQPQVNTYCLGETTPLDYAVTSGQVNAMEKLLAAGADLHMLSKLDKDTKLTPIIQASRLQNQKIMQVLIKNGANVNDVDAHSGQTSMHYIAQKSSVNTAIPLYKILIAAKAKVNTLDKKQRTALHYQVNSNSGSTDVSSEIEQFLINQGSDVYAKDIRGRTPLHYVFVKIGQHKVTTRKDPIELCSTITAAMKGRMIDDPDDFQQTPLHQAAKRGAGVCCMHLLQKKARINAVDHEKNTPLALAIQAGHESCAIMLIQKKANIGVNLHIPPPEEKLPDPSEKKKKERPAWQWHPLVKTVSREVKVTPLFQEVISREWQGVIYMMLDVLDDFGVKYAQTVEAALKTIKYHLAMTLIRRAPSNQALHEKNVDGQTLFHILADVDGYDETLQARVADMLAERNVPMSSQDRFKCMPLHYACLHGNNTLVEFICKHDEDDLDEPDMYGRTPLAALFFRGTHHHTRIQRIVRALERHGADIDPLADYPGLDLELFGHDPSKAHHPYSKRGDSKLTPVITAIRREQFDLLSRLLYEDKMDVNKPDSNGLSPMMHAVHVGNVDIVRLLLNRSHKIGTVKYTDVEPTSTEIRRGIPFRALKKQKAGMKRAHSRPLFSLGKNIKKKKNDNEDDEEEEKDKEEEEEKEEDNDIAADIEDLPDDDIDLDFTVCTNTSKVNLKHQDKNGDTVLHHLVNSLALGSHDNVEILKILTKCGAPLTQVNESSGMSPLDLALEKSAPKLSKAIQKLLNINKKDWEKPVSPAVHRAMDVSEPRPDYKADSQALIDKFERECAKEEGREPENIPEPDKELDMEDTGEVMKDEELDIHYDMLLTKIDVKAGYWGLYNYYKMQVVHQKGQDIYILFTRWGRIGDDGQFQRTPFPNLAEAIKEFRSVFRSKTGNDWKKIQSFVNKPKKYRLVDSERRVSPKKLKTIKLDLKSDIKSDLPESVQDVVKEMTDLTTMSRTITRMGYSEDIMPFGRIKKESLLEARKILEQIKVLVESTQKTQQKPAFTDLDKYHEDLEKISNLSSEYYHLIPQKGYAFERIMPLHTADKLEAEWKHIDTLLELEIASKVLTGAQYRIKEQNPLDYVYDCLGCRITPLAESDITSQYILRYIRSSYQNKVEGIFEIEREGEADRIVNCGLGNRMMLFHGSNTSNLISILSRGLLIAPKTAPITGHAFGKGIYTADMFSKSAGYCYNWSADSDTKFMLICEVALGNVHDHYQTKYMESPTLGYHSTKACGRREPDPQYDVVLPDGSLLPLGKSKDTPKPRKFKNPDRHFSNYIQHNEYIVYKEEQVALKYIVQFQ